MTRQSGQSILVVDDDKDLMEVIASDFSRRGYLALTAKNGEEAFGMICQKRPDLVLTDTHMPLGDGIWLLERVKERDCSIPVVLFTSDFFGFSAEQAYAAGADAVLSKPFRRKELFETVEKALLPAEQRWLRHSERLECRLDIDLKLESGASLMHGRLFNIGRGGMFVAMETGFPLLGTELNFEFGPIGGIGKRIPGTGIVRWIRPSAGPGKPCGCGIEFIFLEEGARQQILEAVQDAPMVAFIPAA